MIVFVDVPYVGGNLKDNKQNNSQQLIHVNLLLNYSLKDHNGCQDVHCLETTYNPGRCRCRSFLVVIRVKPVNRIV